MIVVAWVLLLAVGLPVVATVLWWLCRLVALPFAIREARKYRSR